MNLIAQSSEEHPSPPSTPSDDQDYIIQENSGEEEPCPIGPPTLFQYIDQRAQELLRELREECPKLKMGDEPRPLKDYTIPTFTNHPSCIVLPPCVHAFSIMPSTLQLLPAFDGGFTGDPFRHIKLFNEVCSTVQLNGIDEDNLRLRLFPFSLKDKAKDWLYKIPAASINSWDNMKAAFLKKYFPPSKSNALRNLLMTFQEFPSELFHESWERFKDMEQNCPNHGVKKWLLLSTFYNGSSQDTKRRIDNACQGSFMEKNEIEAESVLDSLAESSQLYDNQSDRRPVKEANVILKDQHRRGGMYEMDSPNTQMQIELKRIEANMNKKLDLILNTQGNREQLQPMSSKMVEQVCLICENDQHETMLCPRGGALQVDMEQCNQVGFQPRPRNDPYSNTYNPGWRNHPNFGWGGNQNRDQGFGNREQGQGFQRSSGGYQGASSSNYNNQGANNQFQRAPYQPPPQPQPIVPPQESLKKPSVEDMLMNFFVENKGTQAKQDEKINVLHQSMSKLEIQMGQLAQELSQRKQGVFPSQVENNPRHEAKAITTLRSGRQVENNVYMPKNEEVVTPREPPGFEKREKGKARELSHGEVILGFNDGEEEALNDKMNAFDKPLGLRVALEEEVQEEALKNEFNVKVGTHDKEGSTSTPTERPFKRGITFNPPMKIVQEKEISLPYPQFQRKEVLKQKNEKVKKEFLDLFRKVEINIPLLDAIKTIPTYAKFLKELCTHKRKFEKDEKVCLSEEVSAVLQRKLPPKLKDPGSFTVPCKIGKTFFDKALMDLGASINLMPYSIYESLGIGEIRPIAISLQMADRSVVYPRGVVENVLVKVQDLILPADFIILDMEEAPLHEKELPIILGRAFMATAGTKIDVKEGLMTMTVHDTTIAFRIFDAMSKPSNAYDCFRIDVLDGIDKMVEKTFIENASQDPLETCLHHNGIEFIEEATREAELTLEALRPCTPHLQPKVEVPLANSTPLLPSIKYPPTLDMKPLPSHLKYAFIGENHKLPVIISSCLSALQEQKLLRMLDEHKEAIGWTIADIKGISPSMCMHKILLEDDMKPRRDPQRRLNPPMQEVVRKEVMKLLDVGVIYPISDSKWVSPVQVVPKKSGITVVANDKGELVPQRVANGWRVCIDYRKLNNATRNDHFPLPFIDQMLERLAGHEYYCFLDGYSGYNQIPIAPEDQDKTTFTCPYGTFAYRRMPFGLCNAPATFQRCMISIFSDMVERFIEVFMDDFSVFGDSFDQCLHHLALVLQRCEDCNLVLNWEKCHFMVNEGIVLGHVVSARGMEVDKAKVELISKLPPPHNVKAIRSFLGHAGFYRRYMKDFSKISKPLCDLLAKEAPFVFDEHCLKAFETIKVMLTQAPIMIAPDWSLPFELMCDASDYAMGAVLAQKKEKVLRAIYYASRTLNDAQINYTTTEKELLAIIFALEKFRSYLLGTKVVVHTDHSALKYLLSKKEAKPRLIRWILLLQEFDIEIKDKPGKENQVADHLSRLVEGGDDSSIPLKDTFPDEQLFNINVKKLPWFASLVNYHASEGKYIPSELDYQGRKRFLKEARHYLWDDPYLFKFGKDQMLRRCIAQEEVPSILSHCHTLACGGHFGGKKTAFKVLSCGFYWPTLFKDAHAYVSACD
ncbi:uncharacterized protein LOC121051265 [Rosa chinensis]|uniref:uncharacterized protein LOC121051265 n=1 Tax=Rosa chinensis TaxID=74649 RepID=UPI001AD8B460|nr:uncharacterized protein LOC121051265 [Rosa chinensis]